VFVDLYSCHREFRDFNFGYFLQQFAEYDEEWFRFAIGERYRSNFWDPVLDDAISFTLSDRVCSSYFRHYTRIPASKRDFYLSKARQFLYLSTETAIATLEPISRVWASNNLLNLIREALDEIPEPQEELTDLAWFEIQAILRPFPAGQSCEALEGVLSSALEQHLVAGRIRPLPRPAPARPKDELMAERKRLTDRCRSVEIHAADIYRSLAIDRSDVHKSDFYKWQRGETPDRSRTAQRFKARILALLKSRGVEV
jgi:hypothetical protein